MKNLRMIRLSRGLSQKALADKARITQAAVSQLEAGLHDPRYTTLLRLSMSLGCFPEDLIGSSPSGPASPGPAEAASKGISHAA